MAKRFIVLLLIVGVLAGCGGSPSPTPDLVATQIAVEEAAHATMTARAPSPTATQAPTPTSTATPTQTPTPTPSPTPTARPTPDLNADVTLAACRLPLEDLPDGFQLTESEVYDSRAAERPEGWAELVSRVAGTGPSLNVIGVDRVTYGKGEDWIEHITGTFQGPNLAHEAALDAREWWSLYGMNEPFDLPKGTLGDEVFAYYSRLTTAEGGWYCNVAVRYGAGISRVAVLLKDSSLSQVEFLSACDALLRLADTRIGDCTRQ